MAPRVELQEDDTWYEVADLGLPTERIVVTSANDTNNVEARPAWNELEIHRSVNHSDREIKTGDNVWIHTLIAKNSIKNCLARVSEMRRLPDGEILVKALWYYTSGELRHEGVTGRTDLLETGRSILSTVYEIHSLQTIDGLATEKQLGQIRSNALAHYVPAASQMWYIVDLSSLPWSTSINRGTCHDDHRRPPLRDPSAVGSTNLQEGRGTRASINIMSPPSTSDPDIVTVQGKKEASLLYNTKDHSSPIVATSPIAAVSRETKSTTPVPSRAISTTGPENNQPLAATALPQARTSSPGPKATRKFLVPAAATKKKRSLRNTVDTPNTQSSSADRYASIPNMSATNTRTNRTTPTSITRTSNRVRSIHPDPVDPDRIQFENGPPPRRERLIDILQSSWKEGQIRSQEKERGSKL